VDAGVLQSRRPNPSGECTCSSFSHSATFCTLRREAKLVLKTTFNYCLECRRGNSDCKKEKHTRDNFLCLKAQQQKNSSTEIPLFYKNEQYLINFQFQPRKWLVTQYNSLQSVEIPQRI
jgi:hypothetical protein